MNAKPASHLIARIQTHYALSQVQALNQLAWRSVRAGTNGYAADNSAGSNLGPTNQKLIDRVKSDVATLQAENPGKPIPVDLITTSGSGVDPDVTPASADFQLPRVAKVRGIPEDHFVIWLKEFTQGRQFGFLGEERVNVLELNLALMKNIRQ